MKNVWLDINCSPKVRHEFTALISQNSKSFNNFCGNFLCRNLPKSEEKCAEKDSFTLLIKHDIQYSDSFTLLIKHDIHYSDSFTLLIKHAIHYSDSFTMLIKHDIHYSDSFTMLIKHDVHYSDSHETRNCKTALNEDILRRIS